MLRVRKEKMLELKKFGFGLYKFKDLVVFRKENHIYATVDLRDGRYDIWDLCNLTYNLTYDLIVNGIIEKGE